MNDSTINLDFAPKEKFQDLVETLFDSAPYLTSIEANRFKDDASTSSSLDITALVARKMTLETISIGGTWNLDISNLTRLQRVFGNIPSLSVLSAASNTLVEVGGGAKITHHDCELGPLPSFLRLLSLDAELISPMYGPYTNVVCRIGPALHYLRITLTDGTELSSVRTTFVSTSNLNSFYFNDIRGYYPRDFIILYGLPSTLKTFYYIGCGLTGNVEIPNSIETLIFHQSCYAIYDRFMRQVQSMSNLTYLELTAADNMITKWTNIPPPSSIKTLVITDTTTSLPLLQNWICSFGSNVVTLRVQKRGEVNSGYYNNYASCLINMPLIEFAWANEPYRSSSIANHLPSSLQSLTVWANEVDESDWHTIASRYPLLKQLTVKSDFLYQPSLVATSAITTLKSLTSLSLDHRIPSLPNDFFTQLPELEHVYLSQLAGVLPDHGYENIATLSLSGDVTWRPFNGTASKLQAFNCHRCSRLMQLPSDANFAEMTSLTSFSLYGGFHSYSGTIPESLFSLPSISRVAIQYAARIGPLPNIIDNPTLTALDFYGTAICGSLPEFSARTPLALLDVRQATFVGPCPPPAAPSVAVEPSVSVPTPTAGTTSNQPNAYLILCVLVTALLASAASK